MNTAIPEQANYGNWVSAKLVIMPGVLTLVFAGLYFWFPGFGIPAIISLLCFLYFAYARRAFSLRGGNIQARVQGLALDHITDWDGVGRVLDIGCGNGPLTIQIAKKYPQAQVVGIDSWGAAWEYSKGVCERNAAIEGVAGRASFERASALSLPFEDGAFDVVVSNLVFHEVRDARDKQALIREALRVLKPGGRFALQDLIYWKQVYGPVDDLLAAIKSWGIAAVECVETRRSGFIPKALMLPFMLGTLGLLHGRK